MGAGFDPYYLWLGIPPEEQPPDHYRLLGIGRFENDPEVIERAADRQIQFLRQMLNTPHGDLARRLISEINKARIVLLDPAKKSAYDAQLWGETLTEGALDPGWPGDRVASDIRPRQRKPVWRRLLAPIMFLWDHPAVTVFLALGLLLSSALVRRFVPPAPPRSSELAEAAAPSLAEESSHPSTSPTSGTGPAISKTTSDGIGTRATLPPVAGDSSASTAQGPSINPAAQGIVQKPSPPSSPAPSVVASSTHSSPADVPLQPGLLGRITVGGEDLGVIVRYMPGDAVTGADLDRLVTQYGLQPGEQTVRLLGVIRVKSGVTSGVPVHLQLTWEGAPWEGVTVTLDGRELSIPKELQEAVWNTSLVLIPGDHPVECRLTGRPWAKSFKLAVSSLAVQPAGVGVAPVEEAAHASVQVGYTEAILAQVSQLPTLARHALNSELASLSSTELAFTPPEESPGPAEAPLAISGGRPSAQRTPIPSPQDVKSARDQIRQEFRKDYQEATAPAAKVLLARMLLKQGNQETDQVRRFAFYQEARELALSGGDFDLAIQAGEALGLNFELDPWSLHLEAAQSLVRNARSTEQREKLLSQLETLAESAVGEDRYQEADGLLEMAGTLAGQLRDNVRKDQFLRRRDEVREIAAAFASIREHLATLQTTPDDPAANEAVGRFYCFIKQAWQKGLPYLVKAETALIRTVAQADLQNPVQPTAQAQLGDDWWAIAETLPEKEKAVVRRHAGYWYLQCEAKLTGDAAQRVRSRLVESGRLINLLGLAVARRVSLQGTWQIGPKAIISAPEPVTQIIFHVIPPQEYDLVVDLQPLPLPPPPRGANQGQRSNPLLDIGRGAFAVGLTQGQHQFLAVVDWTVPNQGVYCFLANCNGRGPDPANPTFQQVQAIRDQRLNTLVYSVRKTDVTVTANGVPIVRYTGDLSSLSMPQGWGTITASRLFFATRGAMYQITRAELRDLGP
ncbi:hypothetical protein [Thermogutta sp.]|uniref:hypothetical protein n=1 Tax=Thermogutta sp. TaxID=1962930 RepID=UPI003C7C8874